MTLIQNLEMALTRAKPDEFVFKDPPNRGVKQTGITNQVEGQL
jgi:hypothetical protein